MKRKENNLKFIVLMCFGLLSMLLMSFSVLSVESVEYQNNENIDLKIPCILNNTNCPNTTTCNISILRPNSSVLIDNSIMTYNPTYFNYSLGRLDNAGQYPVTMTCKNGNLNGYSNFILNIQGLSTNRCPADFSLIWFIGALIALFIVLSLVFKWSFLGILSAICLLILGFTLFGCSNVLGSVIILLSGILFLGFVFMKWN